MSLTEAWASTSKISATDFEAGDSILLEGGSIFTGGMYFSEEDSAQISVPLYISSYGAARAMIDAGKGFGLYAYNVGTIHVHNIDFRGLDPDSSSQAGIYFYTDQPSGKKYKQVTLSNIDVSNFESGIQFGSWHSSYPGYSKIFISQVHAYHNLRNGISTFDLAEQTTTLLAHDSFHISYCYLEDNGFSGLVLGGVNGALVERVKASRTGQLHNKGIVGIWTWNAKDIIFRHCVADSTRTDGGDGGGFDIDGGTENCVIQYCYAFFNDGPGFMHCDYPKSRPTRNNVIRYNISESDGQQPFRDKCSMAFISWGTGLDNCSFYNNTCYTGNKGHGNINCLQAYILDDHDDKPLLQRCSAFNNILYAAGDSNKLVRFSNGRDFIIDTNSLKLVCNNYFAAKTTSARWEDGLGTYTLFSDWQSASGQESLFG
ncbi:MAG TPA: hypothetical protein VL092_03650, partial [Chitinophagaceae bacterium]|nr:hypothetical protein [Chitinophagaceae bacterium]